MAGLHIIPQLILSPLPMRRLADGHELESLHKVKLKDFNRWQTYWRWLEKKKIACGQWYSNGNAKTTSTRQRHDILLHRNKPWIAKDIGHKYITQIVHKCMPSRLCCYALASLALLSHAHINWLSIKQGINHHWQMAHQFVG